MHRRRNNFLSGYFFKKDLVFSLALPGMRPNKFGNPLQFLFCKCHDGNCFNEWLIKNSEIKTKDDN